MRVGSGVGGGEGFVGAFLFFFFLGLGGFSGFGDFVGLGVGFLVAFGVGVGFFVGLGVGLWVAPVLGVEVGEADATATVKWIGDPAFVGSGGAAVKPTSPRPTVIAIDPKSTRVDFIAPIRLQ